MADERLRPLFPDVEPPDPDTELASSEDALDGADGLEVRTVEVATPVGRSYEFDWATKRFVRAESRGVAETFGDDTLRAWIAKTLMTERRGSIVHADGRYGTEGVEALISETPVPEEIALIGARAEEALLVNPRVRGVSGFTYEIVGETLECSFTVLTDDEPLEVSRLELGI